MAYQLAVDNHHYYSHYNNIVIKYHLNFAVYYCLTAALFTLAVSSSIQQEGEERDKRFNQRDCDIDSHRTRGYAHIWNNACPKSHPSQQWPHPRPYRH